MSVIQELQFYTYLKWDPALFFNTEHIFRCIQLWVIPKSSIWFFQNWLTLITVLVLQYQL